MLQEEITKEFEERKTELEPKAVEIYQASDAEIKVRFTISFGSLIVSRTTRKLNYCNSPQALVKNPTEAGIKKKSTAVVKFIEELVKIGNFHLQMD